MKARTMALTLGAIWGLIFVTGPGCSDKDKDAERQAAMLRAQLANKEKELACKVAALNVACNTGDTVCNDNRTKALAECDKHAAASAGGTTTVTNTGTSTSTSTNTSAGN